MSCLKRKLPPNKDCKSLTSRRMRTKTKTTRSRTVAAIIMPTSKLSLGSGTKMWRAALLLLLAAPLFGAQATSPTPAQSNPPSAGTPNGRPPIQTRTKEEFQAYQVAIANEPNPEAMEKAADDFAAKFPNSEARVLLYRAAMSGYQNIGNPQK